ncbi:MAG: DinB family protein [SAR202 cluster bacterium]|nr:DinB family protein [SAR202 cluster bacterium]
MDAVTLLREQFKSAHQLLEGTMQGVTPQQASYTPAGKANPIAASYAHIIFSEDGIVNHILKKSVPLAASTFAGKTGASEAPPAGLGNWGEWSRRVKLDLPAFHKYAEAVYAATDQYIASLKAADLDRTVAMPVPGMEKTPIGVVLGNILHGHIHEHCGEIASVKGLQGAKGYPM